MENITKNNAPITFYFLTIIICFFVIVIETKSISGDTDVDDVVDDGGGGDGGVVVSDGEFRSSRNLIYDAMVRNILIIIIHTYLDVKAELTLKQIRN